MTTLRTRHPETTRRLAPHLVVLAMLIALAPHCLIGCAMAIETMPAATIAGTSCCDASCPMEHPDACVNADADANAPVAILQATAATAPPLAPVAALDVPLDPRATLARVDTEAVPGSPPVPIHLRNAQFLI